jgi:hypothetical protein
VRIALLAAAPHTTPVLPAGVELVEHDHTGPINAHILDAAAPRAALASVLARAACLPAWSISGDGIVGPPTFFCGAAPIELAVGVLRAEAQAAPPLTAASLDILLPVAVARGLSHAELDVRSQLDWASGPLGRWAASHHPGLGLSERERTILGLRLLEVDRPRMATLLAISRRRLGKVISALVQKLERPDLESAVGRLVRLFAARPIPNDGRSHASVRPHPLATPADGVPIR